MAYALTNHPSLFLIAACSIASIDACTNNDDATTTPRVELAKSSGSTDPEEHPVAEAQQHDETSRRGHQNRPGRSLDPYVDPDRLLHAEVAGWNLRLTNCTLETERGEKTWRSPVALPGNCEFARDRDGTVQVVDTEHGKVVLVVSSHHHPDEPGWCKTELRAVTLRNGTWTVSKAKQRRMLCGGQELDTKDFYVLPGAPGPTL